MWIVCMLIVLFLLVIGCGGVVLFLCACKRRKERSWLDASSLKGSSYEKLSDKIQAAHQWLCDHEVEDVYIKSSDGLRLYARWIPAENAKGTVILAHGYRSTPYVDFSLVLEMYHNWGMNMLIPDQRSHGKSEGQYITFGVKECEDILAWVHYHNGRLGNHLVILSGLSMGATTVLNMADMDLPENVKGIIADCGFTSPKEIISSVFRNVTHLPAAPFVCVGNLCAKVFAGFSFNAKDTRISLPNSRVPVVLAHGKADTFVPTYMSQQAYDACTQEKELLLVEGAGHGYSYLMDKEHYTQLVLAFLQRNLGGFA